MSSGETGWIEGCTVLNSIVQQKHLHKSTVVNYSYTPGWVVIRFSRFRAQSTFVFLGWCYIGKAQGCSNPSRCISVLIGAYPPSDTHMSHGINETVNWDRRGFYDNMFKKGPIYVFWSDSGWSFWPHVVLHGKRWIGHISELFSFYLLGQYCVEFICLQNRAKRQVLPSRKMRIK